MSASALDVVAVDAAEDGLYAPDRGDPSLDPVRDHAIARHRCLTRRLPAPSSRCLVVVTGARRTGKSAIARQQYRDLPYLSLGDAEVRSAFRSGRPASWGRDVGAAILDDAHKEPSVFEKVKLAFDSGAIDFTVLLAPSRFDREALRESLGGSAALHDAWPLMASEVRTVAHGTPSPPLLERLLDSSGGIGPVLRDEPARLRGSDEDERLASIEHLAHWGGMPELLTRDDAARRDWLKTYQETFLERDLADLCRLSDLLPFRSLQRQCMLRSGGLLSYAELGRDASLSPPTARRYVEYLDRSYQVFLLPPFGRDLTSSAVKHPKLYWMDLGLLRHETLQLGPLDDHLFETLVVGEIRKWIDTAGTDAEMTFYRTRSGLEVDLLVRTSAGVLGVEIKNRDHATRKDLNALATVADALGDEWRGGMIVHRGPALEAEDEARSIYSVPVHRLL